MRALVVALVALPVLAQAADSTGVVSVADPPGAQVELIDLTRSLRAALAEQLPGVVSPDELRQRMVGTPSTATLTELDRAYSGAVAASQAGDFDGSVRTLRAVVEDLERLPASPEAFAQWSRAMLRLARNEGALGHKGESREVMERLLRTDPTLKVDPEQYPPSFAKQVEDVRTAMKSGPQHKLTVTAPRPSKVFIEGREVGTTPLTLTLAAGSYRVSAVAGTVRLPPLTADLGQGDQTMALDFGLADMYRPDAGPGLALAPSQRAAGIITAGGALKLERLVVASTYNDGDVRYLVGSLYDVRRGSLLREGKLRLAGWRAPEGGLQAMVTFLLKGETSVLVSQAEAPKANLQMKNPPLVQQQNPISLKPSSGEPSGRRPGSVKKWTALGAGILAVGLGSFALYENSVSQKKYSDARSMLRDGTNEAGKGFEPAKYDKLRKDGDTARNVATVSAIGAGVAAGTAIVFGYLGYKESGKFGRIEF